MRRVYLGEKGSRRGTRSGEGSACGTRLPVDGRMRSRCSAVPDEPGACEARSACLGSIFFVRLLVAS